jgi:hypothetical protein
MAKMIAVKCDNCGNVFISGNNKDGLPNGVGFKLNDGRTINFCSKCIIEVGRMGEEEREAFFKNIKE